MTRKSCLSKERARQLIRLIEEVRPMILEIQYSGVELPGHRQTQLDHFSRTLVEGLKLSRKFLGTNRWNLYKNLQLTRKIKKLDKKINHFIQVPMPVHTLANVQQMLVEMQERMDRIEGSTRRLEQSLSEMRIGSGGWVEEALRRREVTEAESDAFGSGGSGKTTLAKGVAKDDAIRSTLQPVEELEICSDDIEPGPPEYCSRKVLMRGGLGLMEPPEVTQWQTYMEIYLMENQLTELSEDPRCPVLLVLFLNRNYKLRTISPSFFDYMPTLEILNLSRTRIKSLPESLFGLSCLKRLFLTHCEMLSVLPPKIGELQQLEVLDLEGTEIMDLPQEVAKLTKLTSLELSFCPRVNRGTKSAKALIPHGTLSALSQLEELSIDVNQEDERWESVAEAIVDEVCGLISLDTLKLYLPRVEHLRKFKWFGTSKGCRLLSHFKFIVGSHDERIMSRLPVDLEFEIERWDRSLKYVNGVGVPIDIQKMLRHATAFFLDRHTDVTKLSDFGIENMEQLKCCIIGECNEIRVIIDGTDMYDETDRSEIVSETWEDDTRFLKSLEYLYVYHMKSLRCIYEGPPRQGSLSHLKCLALVTCLQLTTIFTPDLLKNLDSLEELKVEDCPHVSSLVTREDTPIDDSTYFLANMKRISLLSLPELVSISSGLRIAPNLERLCVSDCPNLESPSTDGIYYNRLRGTKGTLQPVEELEICSDDIEPGPPEYCSRKVLMRGGLGLMEPPEVTQWQTYMEIYLMENQLTELSEDPRCPVLLVLFLNRNYKLRTISPSFFDYMPTLEILNLSRTRIKSLPESLFGLSCLKRLFLTHCEMLSVLPPKIGELQQLEVLDLEGTEIMDLPQEVAKLTKLTCLELSFCPRVNRGTKSAKANALIPQGTLSALSQLEELSIDVNPEDERWESVAEAIIDDICGLISLDTLKLYLPRVEHLRKFKWYGTSKVCRLLSHFKFIVGSHDKRIMSCLPVDLEFEIERWDRFLKYVNGVGVPIDIQKMLRHATAFFLDRHTDVTKLSDFGIENMEQLKCCIIGECNEIRVIIDGTDMYDEADRSEIVSETWEDDTRFLESLENLYVYHMKSLRCIYEGPPRQGTLSHLKCLALVTCPQLTTIFTPGLLKNLDSLEELKVEDCPLILSLVTCEDNSIYESTYFLPSLKRISLFSLPELISISNGLRIAPNLERMCVSDCPNLENPSTDGIYYNRLRGTKGTLQPVEELEICSDDIEPGPPEYCSRKVLMRGGLGLMEPPEVTQWQTYMEIYLMENQLTELSEDPQCPVLLALFLNRNYKLRTISPSFFDYMPTLEILNLSRTRIKSLPESLFGLSCLKRLFLTHCEMLSVLPPKIGELQQLEVLDLEGTEIMDLPQEVAKLTKLTSLELSFCPRVNRGTKSAKANALIPQGTLSALSQLEELSIDVNPEDERWESVAEAIVDEVCGLISLDTLKLYLPRVEHLRKFKWFGTSKVCRLLSHFKFIVGSHDERIMSRLPVDLEFEIERWDRSLKYVNGVGVPIDIQKMLRHATAFFLDRHTDVTKLSDFGIENMEQLKCCIIGECNEIRVIIDGTDMYDEADRSEIVSETWEDDTRFLESLENLYVYHMKSLRCIYEGPPRQGSLSHLKCLALVTCPQLTTIFTPDLLKNLDSLEELKVEDCPHVSSLVTREDTPIDDSTYFLANMKGISLLSLPELVSISSGLRIAPNLERMSIIDCPNLKSLSPDEICCNHLTRTKAQGIPNDASKEHPAPTVVSSTTTVNADCSTFKLKREPKVASRLRKFKFNDLKLAARNFSAACLLGKGGFGSVRGFTNEASTVAPQLRKFSLKDLKLATRNFSPEGLLGQGGFGRVFKGWIEENGTAPAGPGTGLTVAVKIFERHGQPAHEEYLAEVSILGHLVHPNLVKLIGYCVEVDQRLLVYEYTQRGSLPNHLFERETLPLPWSTRMKIALGAAKGLAFLHGEAELQVIFRDFKTSKILLDADYNVKLSGLEVAKIVQEGDDSDTTHAVGTLGYIDPEYVKTGHVLIKSDVYDFGVVLSEILTGRKRFTDGEPSLVDYVRSHLKEERSLYELIDSRLGYHFIEKCAQIALQLAARCLEPEPEARPWMSDVVEVLKTIQDLPYIASPSNIQDKTGSASSGMASKLKPW